MASPLLIAARAQVPKNLRNLDVLTSMMWIVRSLVDNKGIFIEPYVRRALSRRSPR